MASLRKGLSWARWALSACTAVLLGWVGAPTEGRTDDAASADVFRSALADEDRRIELAEDMTRPVQDLKRKSATQPKQAAKIKPVEQPRQAAKIKPTEQPKQAAKIKPTEQPKQAAKIKPHTQPKQGFLKVEPGQTPAGAFPKVETPAQAPGIEKDLGPQGD